MVRVSKIAVWDVDGELFRDAKTTGAAARTSIIKEMIAKDKPLKGNIPRWISENWDAIENRVKAAMAGT
jgi:hypothetical protein